MTAFKKFPKFKVADKNVFGDQPVRIPIEIYEKWRADRVKKLEEQIDDAGKQLMDIFNKGKAPFDRATHGKICDLQGYIRAKEEDLEALKP